MAGVVALLVVLVIALYVCWLMIQPFFNVLMWAAVLAMVFYPLHRRIRAEMRKPTAAAAVSTLLVVLLILLPVTFVTIAVVRELSGTAASFQGPTGEWTQRIPPSVSSIVQRDAARKFLADRLQAWGSGLAASTLVVVGGAVGAIGQMLLVVFTLFYFFRD